MFFLNQATCFTDLKPESQSLPCWQLRVMITCLTSHGPGAGSDRPDKAAFRVCTGRTWASTDGPWTSSGRQRPTGYLEHHHQGFIKCPLCSKPCVKLLGNFKESLSCDLRCRMAFITEESKTQSNLTLINNETTYRNKGTQEWKAMASRERSSVVGTSRSAMGSLSISGWYLTEVTMPGTWS